MNVFIVHAHNESQSFTTALKDHAVTSLQGQGLEVRISDLYAMNWNPVASAADFKQRKNNDYLVYALEQRYNFENDSIADDIKQEIEKVNWCDLLILNFPVYWFSTPAIMKGWIDRVLISGVFYGGRRIYDKGGMKGKLALPVFTMGSRETMFGPEAIHGNLDEMFKHFLQGTLGYCGFSVLKPFIGFHVPYIEQNERNKILGDFEHKLLNVQNESKLDFPEMANFDDQLNPI